MKIPARIAYTQQFHKDKKIRKKRNKQKNKKDKIKYIGSSNQHLKETLSPPVSSSEKETRIEQIGSLDQRSTSTLASASKTGKALGTKQKKVPAKSPNRKKNIPKKIDIHDSKTMHLNEGLSVTNGTEKETSLKQSESPDQQSTSTLASVSSKGKALEKKQKKIPTKPPNRKTRTPKKIDIHDNETMQLNESLPLTNGTENLEKKKKTKTRKRKLELKETTAKKKKMKSTTKKTKNTGKPDGDAVLASDKEKQEQEKEVIIISEQNCLEEEEVHVMSLSGEEIDAINVKNSRVEGQMVFQWMIKPYTEEEFFRNYWEKGPLFVKRNSAEYYNGIFSTSALDKILHEHVVLYTKNLDITSYSDGKRETHNPVGQAHAPVVWDYYNNGCSLRMLNPQTFHRPAWKLLASLQEYFSSFCGANVYLTPPDTQGFAPHWDDIEAFILQLEGKKRWKVYKPRSGEEELPINSSLNLSQDEIGEPILDVTLEPGDLLYFPRGYIHQGHTVDENHSLHITVSTYQKNTWGHLLEKLLPQALTIAMGEDVDFRRGLPRDYLDSMGIVNMDKESPSRKDFIKKVGELVTRLLDFAPIDAAVDQRGASFIHDALPPVLENEEKECSAYGGGEQWCEKSKKVINRVELDPDTPIRLIRGNCLRVVPEEETVNVYHCLENTREYHQAEPQFVELAPEHAPAVEALIHAYPEYMTIESLPLQDDAEKMAVASGLWERGIVMTAKPLDAHYDD